VPSYVVSKICHAFLADSQFEILANLDGESAWHKAWRASIVIQFQTSRRLSALSGRAYIIYGNCVHQINRPDGHSPDLDARSLYKEIACSESGTVKTRGHHRSDAAQKQERILAKFLRNRLHSCLSGRPLTTVRMEPMFYQARHSFEP